MVATERRLKSRPQLHVDGDEESVGTQADEEPLAGSRVRTGLAIVDTGTTRWRSAVVNSAHVFASISERGRQGLST